MGRVEEDFQHFAEMLNNSDYTKEESITILSEYVNSIIDNFIPLANRPHASIVTGDYIKRLRDYQWKFAHGFNGSLAKYHEELDNDVGC